MNIGFNFNAMKYLVKKELYSYFISPIGYVFVSIYIVMSMGTTFFIANFFDANQASLGQFFLFQPWIFLFLIPAVGMRLWSEEKNTGTVEILLTLPITTAQAVIAKFVAGWFFTGLSLLLTFPIAITVLYLGSPDVGQIIGGYVGCFLLAGAYLSVSSLTSAMTRNQVISFVLSVSINFIVLLIGWGLFTSILTDIFPVALVDSISFFSYSSRFESIRRGVIDSRDLIYFFSFIVSALLLTVIAIDWQKQK